MNSLTPRPKRGKYEGIDSQKSSVAGPTEQHLTGRFRQYAIIANKSELDHGKNRKGSIGGHTDKSSYLAPIETESADYEYEQQNAQPQLQHPMKGKITYKSKPK